MDIIRIIVPAHSFINILGQGSPQKTSLLFSIKILSGADLTHLVICKNKKMILDYCYVMHENLNSHNYDHP